MPIILLSRDLQLDAPCRVYMIRLLLCLMLAPAMLLPSGVCFCHYFATEISSTSSGDEIATGPHADACPSDAAVERYPQPDRGHNHGEHAPCGPGIKALVGSNLANFGESLTKIGFSASTISSDAKSLSSWQIVSADVPLSQRLPLYLSLLQIRI